MGLFGKGPEKSPREQVREWTSKIRKQTYLLDRQIRGIQREEAKVKASLKQAAKRGDREVCVVFAKEIVRARKAINRINTSKAQLNSVSLHMNQQAANLRVAGAMEKSAEVMKCMHNLVKVHEISEVMSELSREMMRAGIIEEMMEDTMEGISGVDEEEMEEAVQEEVDKVLYELTAGQLGAAPSAVSDSLPTTSTKETVATQEEEEEEIEEMKKRLEALKS